MTYDHHRRAITARRQRHKGDATPPRGRGRLGFRRNPVLAYVIGSRGIIVTRDQQPTLLTRNRSSSPTDLREYIRSVYLQALGVLSSPVINSQ